MCCRHDQEKRLEELRHCVKEKAEAEAEVVGEKSFEMEKSVEMGEKSEEEAKDQ